MTSSNGNIFRVTDHLCEEFTGHRSFDVFFDLRLNKRLSKQRWTWWFETPLRLLWRHCNVLCLFYGTYLTRKHRWPISPTHIWIIRAKKVFVFFVWGCDGTHGSVHLTEELMVIRISNIRCFNSFAYTGCLMLTYTYVRICMYTYHRTDVQANISRRRRLCHRNLRLELFIWLNAYS